MNPTICALVELVTEHKAKPRLTEAVNRFKSPQVTSLAMRVLSWLRDNARPGVSASRLNRRVSPDMSEFIRIVPGLSQLVTVVDNALRFRDEVSPAERAEIARQAYEMYKPQVSVTYIVPPRSEKLA